MVDQMYLAKTSLPLWLDRLGQQAILIAPRRVKNDFVFAEVTSIDEVVLEYPTTLLPPKKSLLPPRETLLQIRSQSWANHSGV